MLQQNLQSWLPVERLGEETPPYQPTWPFPPPFVDPTQQAIARLPLPDGALIQLKDRRWFGRVIPGWLRQADALKLYEMAFFAPGEILELGSFYGLSTTILALACRNAPQPKGIISVDLDPACTQATQATLRRGGLARFVTTLTRDGTSAVQEFAEQQRRFAFVFVDHSHAYTPVYEVCQRLHQILLPGGFCLFHDYNDIRNQDVQDEEYGVFQAVQDGLERDAFEFYGIYGCTGLYRRR